MTSARLRTTKRAGAVALVFAAGSAGVMATAGSASATDWNKVAQCESGGNWSANTGNGYYGGLQFTTSSWAAAGMSGSPAAASPAQQMAAADRLEQIQGIGAWPVCGRGAGGSSSTPRASRGFARQNLPSSSSTSARQHTSRATTSHFTYLSIKLEGQTREDVRSLQHKLNGRGAHLAEDGRFGPQTDAAVKAFQQDKGLQVDGIYGPRTAAAING